MANVNSYAENVAKLTEAANEILEMAESINEAVTGNEAEVVITDDLVMPSFQNVLNRLDRTERTVERFIEGKGIVETNDGTYRRVSVEAVSKPAIDIAGLEAVQNFSINPNWFFESFQYPRCVVKIDLADKIEPDSDRVYVSRFIISKDQVRLTEDITNDLIGATMSYDEMQEYLANNYIEYKEDKDEIKLPLTYEKFIGDFQVTSIELKKDNETGLNQTWYYLSTINYSSVSEDGTTADSGRILQNGDLLRFNNTLFKIKEINQTESRVRLEYNVGYDTISLYDTLEFYNDPFSEKVVSIGIGVNEIDVVYIKGVNEKFNLLSRGWSNPVAFDTDTLKFDEDDTVTFKEYYTKNVADFGSMMISHVKEGHIPAYGAKTPNAPKINADDLRVVQINTQLDATLDSEKYNKLTSEIASIKSNIEATRNTIAANKNKLMVEYDSYRRNVIQNSINGDAEKLNAFTTQYKSLVDELNTLLNDAGAINYSPKYHVRGFFGIPDPQYTIDSSTEKAGKQEIIGFEIMYRYLHTDETGSKLNTFNFTGYSNDTIESGVFTDWSIITSQILEKKYNSDTDRFEWTTEKNDGTHVTINQIDIPIRSGEKVELKVRSISEAGYPYSPLKSDWSESVIITFPDNLMTDDSVTAILEGVKSDLNSVVLQETLSAAGLYTHMSDTNSRYKHNSDNIEYNETSVDENGTSVTTSMSLTEKLQSISLGEVSRLLKEVEEKLSLVEIEQIGTIKMWFGTVAPSENYLICDGGPFDANAYPKLMAFLQAHGHHEAKTPDLKGRFVVGFDNDDPSFNTLGLTGGEKEHQLTFDELPKIDQGYYIQDATAPGGLQGNNSQGKVDVSFKNGNDASHNNLPPYFVLTYIIRAK